MLTLASEEPGDCCLPAIVVVSSLADFAASLSATIQDFFSGSFSMGCALN